MNSDNRNKKDLLKERDPELVDDYYSRAVQPVARQPIVQSQQAFDTMVLKLRATITELENLNTSESSEKAADIAEGLSSIKTVLNYRGNTYSGPAFFCTNCCECVGPKGNQEHSDLGHIVAKQDTNKPYPGFASQPNTRGLGQPGLFSRCGLSFQKNIQLYGGIVQTMEERLELINNGVTEHTKKGVPAGDPQVYAAWKEERNGTERDRIAVRYPSISDEERKKRLISVGIEPSIYASQLSDVGYGFYQIRIPHDNTCLCANCIIARSTDFLELKFCFPVGDDTVRGNRGTFRGKAADTFHSNELSLLLERLRHLVPNFSAKVKTGPTAFEDKKELIQTIVEVMKFLDDREAENFKEGLTPVRKRYFLSPTEEALLTKSS